jgi:hypothetical protein
LCSIKLEVGQSELNGSDELALRNHL